MIVRELLDYCTIHSVAEVIAKLAKVPKEGLANLEKRCQLIIEELKDSDNYCILEDKNFCFVAVETDKYQNVPYVTLTDLDKLSQNNFDITKVTEFSWFWGQTLGISIDENSFSKYGADALIGGILYHITYFDRTEEEIKPLREAVEKEIGLNKTSQVDFYAAVNHQICEQLINK